MSASSPIRPVTAADVAALLEGDCCRGLGPAPSLHDRVVTEERWGACGLRRDDTWLLWSAAAGRQVHVDVLHTSHDAESRLLLLALPQVIHGVRVVEAHASRSASTCLHPSRPMLASVGFRDTGDVGLHPCMRWEMSRVLRWGRRLSESVGRWQAPVPATGEALRTGTGTAASPR